MHQRLSILPAIIVAILLFPLLLANCTESPSHAPHSNAGLPAETLAGLNRAISKSEEFLKAKETRLDSVKAIAARSSRISDRWDAYLTLSEAYRQMDVDSAITYALKAQKLTPQLPDSSNTLRADLAFIDALSTGGIFPPALQHLDSLRHKLASPADKICYWLTARRCYAYLMAWGGNNEYYDKAYRHAYHTSDDSLLRYLPADDKFREFIVCERLVEEASRQEAILRLERLLHRLPQESNLYGMAAYQLAIAHRQQGDFDKFTKYIALAAESDIKGGIREGVALPDLANWVYEHGDIDNASRYVNHILENANSGNIRMRTSAIAPIVPLIDTAIQKRTSTSRTRMVAYIIVTTVLFIATIILLGFTLRTLKNQRQSREKLAASSKKLESYIGNFIGLCSNYAARLDQLSKLVTRKIAAGQTEELTKLISSGKFAEGNNEEFYHLIDKALLDIFPDFVSQINSLLLPDKQIQISPDEPLSPELRIYAFVRLGVDQSSRIAQILGYSVNTVYAYRNRMRNRASDRDNFDLQVTSLG